MTKNRRGRGFLTNILIRLLLAVCLSVPLISGGVGVACPDGGQKEVATDRDDAPKKGGDKAPDKQDKQDSEAAVKGRAILWEDPVDLESRDLFFGIGGERGAPSASGKYVFVRREIGGASEKIAVEDERDRKWTVKLGLEPRPETAATRIVWAVGYHVDQDYFLRQVRVRRGNDDLELGNVRFERDDDGFKKVGRWDWQSNPFVGTREFDGLKTLMALLNNFDLKTENNKIVQPKKKKASEPAKTIYYVNDLGATLGSTGLWLTSLPLVGEMPSGTKGVPEQFAKQEFIEEVRDGKVIFHMQRRRARRALDGVKVENACWMGELLARLSDKQLSDAFRAGGFDEKEAVIYLRAIRRRIDQLRSLMPRP